MLSMLFSIQLFLFSAVGSRSKAPKRKELKNKWPVLKSCARRGRNRNKISGTDRNRIVKDSSTAAIPTPNEADSLGKVV